MLLVTGLNGCAIDDYGYDDYGIREDDCLDDHEYYYEYVESYSAPDHEHCDGPYADDFYD